MEDKKHVNGFWKELTPATEEERVSNKNHNDLLFKGKSWYPFPDENSVAFEYVRMGTTKGHPPITKPDGEYLYTTFWCPFFDPTFQGHAVTRTMESHVDYLLFKFIEFIDLIKEALSGNIDIDHMFHVASKTETLIDIAKEKLMSLDFTIYPEISKHLHQIWMLFEQSSDNMYFLTSELRDGLDIKQERESK